ncbi:hypothetical protein BT67DRAFT_260812 [Trichocladium antarcticum]|uniref:Uncharacterized protein n=1 Tax=Trichocladium antarcticum TaxID=1450529 RepID=A0AAN6UN08_9PEZI|nr:hypothetical protein BT67DRAFT_260812 [Trichocladium antarcticum]
MSVSKEPRAAKHCSSLRPVSSLVVCGWLLGTSGIFLPLTLELRSVFTGSPTDSQQIPPDTVFLCGAQLETRKRSRRNAGELCRCRLHPYVCYQLFFEEYHEILTTAGSSSATTRILTSESPTNRVSGIKNTKSCPVGKGSCLAKPKLHQLPTPNSTLAGRSSNSGTDRRKLGTGPTNANIAQADSGTRGTVFSKPAPAVAVR